VSADGWAGAHAQALFTVVELEETGFRTPALQWRPSPGLAGELLEVLVDNLERLEDRLKPG
jgi:hypothetical protein